MMQPFRQPFRRARSRIVAAGTLATMLLLAAFAFVAREAARRIILNDIDDELETLSVAIASDLEARGIAGVSHESLRAGVEANTLVYRLEHHSALLFDGRGIIAASGDLARRARFAMLASFARRSERPFDAVEPFSQEHRLCRFRVTHLQQHAAGTTLLIFRPIDAVARTLEAIDLALALLVLTGATAAALILGISVARALRPVEKITAFAESVTPRGLAERVTVDAAGEEFDRLAAVINSLLGRLEQAFDAQRRFVSDAAHELKTPAAVIAAEAHELRREGLSPAERRESLEIIGRAVSGLAREVDDLLELARRDGAPPRIEQFLLGEAIDEAIAIGASAARERTATIRKEAAGDVQIEGERAGLVRALSNLVVNAIRYSPAGSEVRIAVRAIDDVCEIDVADRGPGVPSAERQRIFERFVRLAPARREHPEGSGLGLAIVEQIVSAHGGSVEVLDHEGGGALFRVRLPVTSRSSTLASPPAWPLSPPSARPS
jgi:signal transduction histidine kinase